MKTKIVVGVTGASGTIYGLRLLKALKGRSEIHLIVSDGARMVAEKEEGISVEEMEGLADKIWDFRDLSAPIASGSFKTDGMVIVPCSIKTLSAVANAYNENLIVRAADVTLKERRKLILVVRETPFTKTHLELMLKACESGAVILPPIPAFYHQPKTLEDIIDHTVGKILDMLGIDHNLYKRWGN